MPGHLGAQQFLDRQLAAPVRQADDDAIDAVFRDQAIHVGRGADDRGIDDPLAEPRRVVVDEADDAVGKLVLVENLARDLARRFAGADKQDALLIELEGARDAVEGEPPAEDGDEKDEQRRDEGAVPDHQLRHREIERREQDRCGPHGLEQPDYQFAVRVDQRQVVEVVVIQTQLADQRDHQHLPQVAGEIRRALESRRERHRPEDQQQFAAEHRQAARRDVPVEQLHRRLPDR